ncbi:hypothetical protein PFFCH_04820 [Plasmodium falciparum FCH/4]|uniref:Duffy-binding-like domain-containing protein n=1 Tax=Plasmodium falciparum FCH/4 TaxID=1036724 RepID=A0A024VGJ9_PLAFA|nr:hypothetical protein PFFCH_04820 [Plasmodium falciparum FCH/4]
MAPQGSGGPSAKDVFDKIGEKIQKEAHNDALTRSYNELQGRLSEATYANDTVVEGKTLKACDLDHIYHTNVTDGHNDPCGNRPNVRFSDKYGGQCTDSKIKGNRDDKVGACAPFRRLFLCDQNLSHMQENKIKNTHNLLLEVSLAAQHEGESIVKNYEQLGHHTTEGVCTALARSFADIGDIIRGKDLFLGYNKSDQKEKEKLQENLKNIFKNIHGGLKYPEKAHYNDPDGNFYQLREHWWNANRLDIWKAITCKAENAQYFRNTCSNGQKSTQANCQCIDGTVPTNLDYVPQHLRWFEEWAEEFCRIKELKLVKLEKECRGENDDGKKRYCSRNGHNCEETIRAIGKLRLGNGCTRCLFACNPYVEWIKKKKEEFQKQKKKCEIQIFQNNEPKVSAYDKINNLYYQDFYTELKRAYPTLTEFLKSLNKETTCKNLQEDKKNNVDFNNDTKTFSYSKYCDLCPWCAVKLDKDGNFVEKRNEQGNCEGETLYTPKSGVHPTVIDVLSFGDEPEEIKKNLENFCASLNSNMNSSLYEIWKCYYEDDDNEACILQKLSDTKVLNQKPFFDFFDFWVSHMLKDSIYWRKKRLNKCLKNKTGICINKCNSDCKCFERWVSQKEKEWTQIKKHFEKQHGLPENHHFTILETVLKEQFLPTIEEAYGDIESMKKIEKFLEEESTKEDSELKDDKKDAIDFLLKHEKEDAELCLQTHEEQEKCADEDDDSDDDDHEEPPIIRSNPCPNGSSTRHPVLANKVAHQIHELAKLQLSSRGRRKALRANASLGTYKRGGQKKNLNGHICNIDTSYSNDYRNITESEPCTGKDGRQVRFKIGNGWTHLQNAKTTYSDVFLPPRREHMCTSNLEKLNADWVTENDKTIHSLLGDVQLAAKMDAERIKELYRTQNNIKNVTDPNYQETVCRAVRYSFADLGDIIRGRDMWDKDGGSSEMEKRLIDIFKNIKSNLPIDIQKEYVDSKKFLDLRRDWWEANRHKVWKAMQCSLKTLNSSTGDCAYSRSAHPPYDDYIPQRLRWMTEWAEWFCKEQKKQYEALADKCKQCKYKNEGKDCTQSTPECNDCKPACVSYGEKIKKWKEQWEKMEIKYKMLYAYAQMAASRNGDMSAFGTALDEKDKHVVQFLQKVYEANKTTGTSRSKRSIGGTTTDPTTPYSTAAGYIHQELPNVGCNTQTEFCDKKNGIDNTKYAFKNPPPDYVTACGCNERLAPIPKKLDVCNTVKTLLNAHAGQDKIDSCNEKNDRTWNCSDDTFNEHNKGACMPPRRQALCIYNLEAIQTNSQDDLKKAFVKCAAIETYFLWKHYKIKNHKADDELNSGKIPETFKRQMFYTFGDYRDLCLDTDISKLNTHTKAVKTNIDRIFPPTEPTNDTIRKEFWERNAKDIWKGMLCALEKAGEDKVKFTDNPAYNYETVTFSGDNSPNLQKFTTRPQFLRWMTEWGEHFCRERKVQFDILAEKCGSCTVDGDDGTKCNGECVVCHKQCQAYQRWLQTWKEHYEKQKIKYKNDKDSYTNDPDTKQSPQAYQYLNKKLEKICPSGNTSANCEYKCMEQASSQNGKHMPESLDDTPNEYKDRCTCKDKEAPTPRPSDPPAKEEEQQEEACTIVDNIFKDEDDDYFKEACRQKYKGGKEIDTQWKCTTNKTKKGGQDEVCIPPRRQKLYVYNLTQLKDTSSQTELRRAFVQCAAIETFLAWHKYKMDKKQTQQQNGVGGLPLSVFGFGIGFDEEDTTIEEDPQEQLNGGDIPDQFKRQMFYTFGDYRDILFGKDVGNGNDIEEVKNKIKTVFQNSTDPDEQNDNEREKWWEQHGKDIWKGMVCVLSYDTDSKQIKQDVQDKLVGSKRGNKYDYTNVSFSGGFNSDKNAATITTKLEEFSRRPTFFRWLEEWGEEFCKKRTYKLKRIKDECRSDKYGKRYSSGDGEDCQNMLREDYNIVPDLEYPGCGKSCKSYKDWINTKKKRIQKTRRKIQNGNFE